MTDAERRRVIDDICDAALERDESERAAFVAGACGDDEALRREVEALLSHARAADAFLAAPLGEVAAHALTDRDAPSLVGRQFGPHKIVALLGAGGMGQVYRARDAKLGRDVAIKVAADLVRADPGRLARFEREARVLATLNHPHIGAIYGVEESEGVRGLVLELVEGQTLAERLAHGPLPIREALEIARQVADAVEAAHERGVIHRDLKPANIKITPDGVVKVLDFGLAKVFARDEVGLGPAHLPTATMEGTQEGVIAGTAAYMSPEQARGLPIDKRTDVWAFGCVLYEMLTRRVPFPGPTVSDTIARILERQPDWTILPAPTPPGIQRLLRRCLEKDPKRRVRDIGDARLDIEEALRPPESLSGTHAGAVVNPLTVPARRRGRVLWAIAAAAILLAIGYAVMWQPEPAKLVWLNPLDEARSRRLTEYPGAEHHAAISRDGRTVAFLWNAGGVWDAWSMQIDTGALINLTQGQLAEVRNPATRTLAFNPGDLLITLWSRRWNDAAKVSKVNAYWAVSTNGGQLRQYLKEMPGVVSEVDWSPDGERIVFHPPTDGDPLIVANKDGKEPREIYRARSGMHCHFPTFSPHGDFIYFVQGLPDDEGDIWRIPPAGGGAEQITFHNSRVSFPTFIDDRTLLYLATDKDGAGPWIYAIDVDAKDRQPHKISIGVGAYTSLAGSADGSRLVATDFRSTGSLWKVPITDRAVDEFAASKVSLSTASGLSPRFGPDFFVYLAPKGGTNVLYKSSGGTSDELLYDGFNGRAVAGPAISRSGRLAFVVKNEGVSELWVMNADRSRHRVAAGLDVRGSADWSRDEQWLAIAALVNGEPRVHKIHVESGKVEMLVKDEYSIDPRWSPSGTYLVYSGADVGTKLSVKAVNEDGSPHELARLDLSRGERRLVFVGEDRVVFLQGDISNKEFWLGDLRTGAQTKLTKFGRDFDIRDFDVSADGREIIFDRTREESDLVLIELRQPRGFSPRRD